MDRTLDDVTARWNLLEHSFYQRWTRGTLTHAELCDYVKQYAYVVRAVPVWLEQVRAADTAQIVRHAAEEQSHIALWNKFGEALGLSSDAIRDERANVATAKLIRCGDELAASGEAAPDVCALDVQTPAVSGAKMPGLSSYYAMEPDTGGAYFSVHQRHEVAHPAQIRSLRTD